MRYLAFGFVICVACSGKKAEERAAAPAPKPVEPAAPAPKTAAIAVVFETQHLWLGNDSWWEGNKSSKTEGYYKPLGAALDALAKQGPPDAQVALIAYGDGANVMWQGKIADLAGDKIGPQRDLTSVMADGGKLVGQVGIEPGVGIELARTTLLAIPADARHLLVIGDGNNNGPPFSDERAAFAKPGWDASAVFLAEPTGVLEGNPGGWKVLTDQVKNAANGEELAATVGGIAASWR